MNFAKKLSAVFLIILSVLSLTIMQANAAENHKYALSEEYKKSDGKTMIVSDKGDCTKAPENSLMAIHEAENSGADIIKINVRTTADGVLILMADETVERTCYGYGENTAASEMTYDEISKLTLLDGNGGHDAKTTTLTVPTLEEIFEDRQMYYLPSAQAEQKALLMLDFDWSIRDKISNLVIENSMQNEVIFYIDDAKPEEISTWKASLPFEPMIMTYFKGNIIFAATANVKDDSEIADGIHLATKNPYGVIFGETVQGAASEAEIRAMAAPCLPEICGSQIQDTEVYWDYLISAGFNVIMTDNVSRLKAYLKDCDEKERSLDAYFNDTVKTWTLPDFNSDKFLDYKRAYGNAYDKVVGILDDNSSSRSDIVSAEYEIKMAIADINASYDELSQGTAGMTVTPVRILLCIAAVAVVIAAEVYVYRKKKK